MTAGYRWLFVVTTKVSDISEQPVIHLVRYFTWNEFASKTCLASETF